MRVAFVGKGGSGKSTIATLFARHLAAKKEHVLAIDADINQHLGTLLGISGEEIRMLPSLGNEMGSVRSYVQGSNLRIKDPSHIRMTTPPATGSRVIFPNQNDPLLSRYIMSKGGVYFATTGEFSLNDVGMICYHGKTMATEIVLNHLADATNEYVVVDMTAGADAFSTGIFLKFDMIVLVVEPTLQSLSVFDQYKEYGNAYGLHIKVVGNKVEDMADESLIVGQVGESYMGALPYTREIRNLERNKEISPQYVQAISPVLDSLHLALSQTSKNWAKFYDDLVTLHRKHAESWLNDSFQIRFEDQIDPSFDPETFYAR